MFPRPYALPAAVLLAALVLAVTGFAFLAGALVGLALGLSLWALGVQRAVRPLIWFGAGIAGFAVLVIARAVFF
jgi:hypothetical protein